MRTPVISSFLPCNNMRRSFQSSGSVTHAKAAVNREDGASDVCRVLRRDEPNRCGDLLRGGEATRGDTCEVSVLAIFWQVGRHISLDDTRGNDVSRDPPAAQLTRDRPRQPDQGRLAGGVVRLSGRAI